MMNHNKNSKLFLIMLGMTLISQYVLAAELCAAKSGPKVVPLLELYTSEGCSSCPPADLWLSHLKTNKGQVTPVAFHVDYWDYIGWKDRFAKPQFSARQREGAKLTGAGFVYTPQFILNGQDFKGAGSARFNQTLERIVQQPSKVLLGLQSNVQASGETLLTANAQTILPTDNKNAQVFVAIYQNQLDSKVNAGENSGHVLKHDFVVREFFGGYPLNGQFNKRFTLKPEWQGLEAGAVIFVQDAKSGEVLQSLQLPFCA